MQSDLSQVVEDVIAEKRIGARIKALRVQSSLGLVELGTLTGLSASFLSQLETGRVVPTLRNLTRLSVVFQVDLNYFFKRERNKPANKQTLLATLIGLERRFSSATALARMLLASKPEEPSTQVNVCVVDISRLNTQ